MKWIAVAAVVMAVFTAELSQALTFNTHIPMEDSFYELECPHPGDFQYWLLHGEGDAMYPTEEEITSEQMTIYANGSIIFQSLKMEHSGVHLCVRKTDNTITAHSVPLTIRPLPSQNLWSDVYQAKFLTGLVAAAVCFLLFTLSCFVYNKRWRPLGKESDVRPIIENGYDNPAMVTAEPDSSSTKM